jgi:lipoprotein signal peptidase
VVDFIDIGFWPIGNIADFSIVIGVGILAYYLWNEDQQKNEPLHLSNEGGEV